MRRRVMDSGFRRIKAAPVSAAPQPDPRLALVDLFKDSQVFRPEGTIDLAAPLPGGFVDLSGDAPDYGALFVEDTQEPSEQPEPDGGDTSPEVAPEAAHETPAEPEPVVEPVAPEQVQGEKDYDPIAAVLG